MRGIGAFRICLLFMLLSGGLQWFCGSASAQSRQLIDSLQAALQGSADEKRVDILNELTKRYTGRNNDSAFYYNDQARSLAEKLRYTKGLAMAFNHLGNIYYYLSQYTADTIYQRKALQLFQQIGDSVGVARSYASLGLVFYALGKYDEALKCHSQALRIRKALGDKESIADSYATIGLIYFSQGDYSSALEYQRMALSLRQEINDERSIALSNNYLGNIYKSLNNSSKALEYFRTALQLYEKLDDKLGIAIASNNLAGIYAEERQNDKAMAYYQRSLSVYKELDNKVNIASTHNYIGKVYENLGQNAQAREYYSMALYESVQIEHKKNIAMSYNNLGALDYKEKRYPSAIYSLEKAITVAEEAGIKEELRSAYLMLSKALAATGDYGKAYRYHTRYSQLQEDLHKIDIDKISELEVRVMSEKKDKEIQLGQMREKEQLAEVKKQKIIKYSFLIGAVLLLGFVAIIYNRLRFIRKQKSIIEHEQKRSEELLLNILPADVAQELKEKGKSTARRYESVTVMFTDIENFTRIGEKMAPEKLVDEIDFYFKAFDNIIVKYGIEKIKTIGDAYMCAGGLHNKKTSPADVIYAALEIMDFMERTKMARMAQGEPYFEIRVGIHTGPVVAGIVGLRKFAYDIWGDAVNTAARMETASETSKINISGATFELVQDQFNCTYRGKIEVKNKGMMDMYFVEGPKATDARNTGFEKAKDYILKRLDQELPANLYYHGLHHTLDVLRVTSASAKEEHLSEEDTELLKLAALYHDSGFMVRYDGHEEAGCQLARETLPQYGYKPEKIEKVCELIMATKVPQQPKNHLEKILCDADLDYLGRADYNAISGNLYSELREYGYTGDHNDWLSKQEAFLTQHRYFLNSNREREQGKLDNLNKLKNTESSTIKTKVMSAPKVDRYLVPTDFSEVSDCAINHAAESARVTHSEVVLMHVVDSDKKTDDAEARLQQMVNEVEQRYGVKASYIAREGSIFDTIGEVASEIHARLIFMGTHGVVGLQQKLLGAFALRVINTSPAPVVVVQKKKMASNGYDTIVYPMDSSRESKQKMADTLSIAKLFNAEVHIFAYPESDEFLHNALVRNVNHAKKYLTENNIRFKYAEANPREGDYSRQMMRYASQVGADLIVIMSKSEKGIKEFIIGPDEEKIINNDSQIAVMCVNPVDHNMVTDSIVY